MGRPIVIKYTYLAECCSCNQEKMIDEKNIRTLVDSLFLFLEDKSSEYTKIKIIDNDFSRGKLILKSSNHSHLIIETKETIDVVLFTIQSSSAFNSTEMGNIIIKHLKPDHFNDNYIERILP